MKLWHDDVRPPPEGWVWARTNFEAIHLLTYNDVEACSLDHDLGLHDVDAPDPGEDPDGFIDAVSRVGHGAETGLDLVEWMIENNRVPASVTIHSWNPDGARYMAARLNRFGYDAIIAPYVPPGTVSL